MELFHHYQFIVDKLVEVYSVQVKKEHKYVYEFFEGPVPLFKLLFGISTKPGNLGNRILVCFHLNLNSVDAIQWYLRVKQYHGDLYMTECYFKDDNNETFIGQGAELIKMYKEEQRILSNWVHDKDDTKKFLDQKILGRAKHKLSNYDFTDREQAMKEFNKMDAEDEDKCH